jgi:hypothetical protein
MNYSPLGTAAIKVEMIDLQTMQSFPTLTFAGKVSVQTILKYG